MPVLGGKGCCSSHDWVGRGIGYAIALLGAVYHSTTLPSSPRYISVGWLRFRWCALVATYAPGTSCQILDQMKSCVRKIRRCRTRLRCSLDTFYSGNLEFGRSGEIGGASMADAVNAANMKRATHNWQALYEILPYRYRKLFQSTSISRSRNRRNLVAAINTHCPVIVTGLPFPFCFCRRGFGGGGLWGGHWFQPFGVAEGGKPHR